MKLRKIGDIPGESITSGNVIPGLAIRKKMSYSTGYGFAVYGKTKLGDPRFLGGIYQKRRGKSGRGFVKMRSYAPTNPNTTAQQLQRWRLFYGMLQWKFLDPVRKQQYIDRAERKNKLGHWLWMKYTMNRPIPVEYDRLYGYTQYGYPTLGS